MKLALLLLVAVSAFGEPPFIMCGLSADDDGPDIGIGRTFDTQLEWTHTIHKAEQALEDNVRDIIGGPAIAIKDGTLLCSDGECVVFRANGAGALTIAPAIDKLLLAAVRIYRYKLARGEAPVDAAASTCADGEAQVGDACDVQDSGLLFMLGATR